MGAKVYKKSIKNANKYSEYLENIDNEHLYDKSKT